MEELQTIGDVVEQHLCHSCGTCAGVCPRGAIAMIESPSGFLMPQIDDEQCNRCGLCLSVCPTYQEEFVETSSPRGRLNLLKAWQKGRPQSMQRAACNCNCSTDSRPWISQ